jgi:hypothetical protein
MPLWSWNTANGALESWYSHPSSIPAVAASADGTRVIEKMFAPAGYPPL